MKALEITVIVIIVVLIILFVLGARQTQANSQCPSTNKSTHRDSWSDDFHPHVKAARPQVNHVRSLPKSSAPKSASNYKVENSACKSSSESDCPSPRKYKDLFVPSQFPTIDHAITYAFSGKRPEDHYRIILETQGPHAMAPDRHVSLDVESLEIKALTSTDHMGMFYGHLTHWSDHFGVKEETDSTISGEGPFALSLSGGNSTISVVGTEVDFPYGFGAPCFKAPGWAFGQPPGVILGIDPDFTSLRNGDVIRWYDANTGNVTDHTITSKTATSLTVNPPVAGPLVEGSGFSVRPRATITFAPIYPFLPEIVMNGDFSLTGVQLAQGAPGPFPSILSLSVKGVVDVRKCLFHTELATQSGSRMFAYSPNTWMDETNGGFPAKIVMNAGGAFFAFRQSFVGRSAGVSSYGSSHNTLCFSQWIGCDKGILLRAASSMKTDGAEFVDCDIGVELDSAMMYQTLWFRRCNTAMLLKNGSKYDNVRIIEFGPLPNFPVIIDGQGSGIGIICDTNSQVYTTHLRLADLTTHAIVDGTSIVIPHGIVNTSTVVSDLGTGTFGSLLSGIQFNNSWTNTSEC
jgi:hypothetical protein